MTATNEPQTWLSDHEAETILRQIGRGNVLAISGGRSARNREGALILPVRYGYDVAVTLDRGSDTYTVERRFTRNGRSTVKGRWSGVYADEVGDMAYHASCYHDAPVGADQ